MSDVFNNAFNGYKEITDLLIKLIVSGLLERLKDKNIKYINGTLFVINYKNVEIYFRVSLVNELIELDIVNGGGKLYVDNIDDLVEFINVIIDKKSKECNNG